MRSPSALLVAAVAGGMVALLGGGVPGALAGALAGWGARVLLAALWRPPRPAPPDPFAVGEPWRHHVQAVLRHQRRFTEACSSLPDGPLRQRLEQLGTQVDDTGAQMWEMAQAGHRLSRARRDLGPRGPGPAADPGGDHRDAELVHLDATGRLDTSIDALERQLGALEVQLGAVVARAIEITATAGTATGSGTERDLTALMDEMEALRLALDELGATEGDTG